MEPELEGWIAPHLPKSKGSGTFQPALRCIVPMQRCAGLDRYVSFLRQALDFTKSGGATGGLPPPVMSDAMDDHTVNGSGQPEQVFADIDIATRRLMAALDALERAVERRRDADRAKATQVAVANALNAAADRIEKTTQVLNRTIGGGVAIG